jgi:hypothetical protein
MSAEMMTAIAGLELGPDLDDLCFATIQQSTEYWHGRQDNEMDQSGSATFQKTLILQFTLHEEQPRLKEGIRLVNKMNQWKKQASNCSKPRLSISTKPSEAAPSVSTGGEK